MSLRLKRSGKLFEVFIFFKNECVHPECRVGEICTRTFSNRLLAEMYDGLEEMHSLPGGSRVMPTLVDMDSEVGLRLAHEHRVDEAPEVVVWIADTDHRYKLSKFVREREEEDGVRGKFDIDALLDLLEHLDAMSDRELDEPHVEGRHKQSTWDEDRFDYNDEEELW